ncbi:MAG: hypothetical protein ACK5H2_05905 [Beutenbergiaceae bacterium]
MASQQACASTHATGGLDGVVIVSWSDSDGDWVLTSSGLGADLSRKLAGAAATGGPDAMAGLVADFLDVTPSQPITRASGLSWIAEYGPIDAIESSIPTCPQTGGCLPSDATGVTDHLTLEVSTYGVEGRLP